MYPTHRSVATKEVCALPVDLNHVYLLLALEDVQSPSFVGFPRLWGFVVLEHNTFKSVCLGSQSSRVLKVWLGGLYRFR